MAKPNAHIAKIHVAKAQLGMDEVTYRTMLQQVAGVASSKQLDERGVDKVMAHLQRIGFQPKSPTHGKRPVASPARNRLIGKIEAQLTEAGRPWAYADGMASRMFKVDKVAWLKTAQLSAIVAALAYDAKRHGREYAG